MDSKALGDNGRENSKQKAISQATEARNESEEMRVLYVERADLRNGEDSGGDDKTPYTTGM